MHFEKKDGRYRGIKFQNVFDVNIFVLTNYNNNVDSINRYTLYVSHYFIYIPKNVTTIDRLIKINETPNYKIIATRERFNSDEREREREFS